MVEDSFLMQVVIQPTRKNNILDLELKVPMQPRRINGAVDPPWMTMVIKTAINTKKRNYNLMRGTNMAEARTQYHTSLRACRTLIRTIKRNYEKQLAREVKINPKKFFTYIR